MMMTITGANEGNAPIPANEPALVCREAQLKQPFHYWRGASGRRYLHTVFPLIDCPLMHKVNYILVKRDSRIRTNIEHLASRPPALTGGFQMFYICSYS